MVSYSSISSMFSCKKQSLFIIKSQKSFPTIRIILDHVSQLFDNFREPNDYLTWHFTSISRSRNLYRCSINSRKFPMASPDSALSKCKPSKLSRTQCSVNKATKRCRVRRGNNQICGNAISVDGRKIGPVISGVNLPSRWTLRENHASHPFGNICTKLGLRNSCFIQRAAGGWVRSVTMFTSPRHSG